MTRSHPTPVRLYCVAMYWAFTTLTTVGYGDVLPVSRSEMAVTVIVQFAGTCILGYARPPAPAKRSRARAREGLTSGGCRERPLSSEAARSYRRSWEMSRPC